MAIAKIKKLEIIGLEKDKEEILGLLQKLGIMELINLQTEQPPGTNIIAQETSPEVNLLEIEEAISYFAGFKKESGFLAGMVKIKPLVYAQQLKEVLASFNYADLLKGLSALRNHLRHLQQHREKLIQEKQLLAPWSNLDLPLNEIQATRRCAVLLGILRSADYANFLKDCEKINLNLHCEIVNRDQANNYLLILHLKEELERLEAILKEHHFNFVILTHHKAKVKERILEINREVLVLDDQLEDTKNKIKDLADQQFKLMIIYDYFANLNKRQDAEQNLAKQQFTFTLSGWMRQKDSQVTEQELSMRFKDIAIFISGPQKDEAVPVILENKRLIEPFEFITNIYGMPQYHELDPTPFLAPFFFLYFGFCVSDVGYGTILTLISWFALKKFKMGPQGLKFWRLFLFCGISTIIIGALTGSWFGNAFDMLAQNNKVFLPLKKLKDSFVILNPLQEPTKLLGIALSFGIIQVWFGNLVAAIGNLKNKRYLAIFFDQVPMLMLLFGLTGLGLIFLNLLNPTHLNLFKYATICAAIALILTQGRSEKTIGAKLFYGIYNLYNALSGYLSDILSYSRLWALGLVTGVMASTINLIAIQFSQIIPSLIPSIDKVSFIKFFLSALILVAIFIFGHAISFLMNLLGAFVHPVRLQFVEFFSKFFRSGGRSFKPFRVETKYINLS